MSFANPALLSLLALIPVLLLAYSLFQLRRPRYAVRFSNLALLSNMVPHTPAWRRYLPPAAYALALIALITALAKPQSDIKVPKDEGTVMLVIDVSGSMDATDVQPTRLLAAIDEAERFVDQLPPKFQVGVVSFSSSAQVLTPPIGDRTVVRQALESMRANGGTAMGDGIELALNFARPQSQAFTPGPAGPAGSGVTHEYLRPPRGTAGSGSQSSTSGQPGSASQPGATGQPGSGSQPGATGQPGSASQPGATGQPGSASQPGATGQPGSASQPGATGQPGSASQPGATGQPGSASQPGATGQPGSASQPGATGQPGSASQPGATATNPQAGAGSGASASGGPATGLQPPAPNGSGIAGGQPGVTGQPGSGSQPGASPQPGSATPGNPGGAGAGANGSAPQPGSSRQGSGATPPSSGAAGSPSPVGGITLGGQPANGGAATTTGTGVGGSPSNGQAPMAIVLLSDGASNAGRVTPEVAAKDAASLHVPIYTIALGTPGGILEQSSGRGIRRIPVPPDPATLQRVAGASGGKFFNAPSDSDLKSIYQNLATKIAFTLQHEDVTPVFIGAAAILLLAGGGLAAMWFHRFP
ncbi:MAG: VWA domain-containing protein [Chloroflexi bacterium]|nr:VWA domain-containing protein [Chloroflexota bacterium]